MKKLRLKRWVKVTSIVLVLIVIAIISNKEYHNAVNDCVKSGNTYQFCVESLK